jgi:hypothetical protein
MFINLTPHEINIQDTNGDIISLPSNLKEYPGVGRINFTTFEERFLYSENMSISVKFKDIDSIQLPPVTKGFMYIVSLPTLLAIKNIHITRLDIFASDTDNCVRDKKGQIKYVKNLIQ